MFWEGTLIEIDRWPQPSLPPSPKTLFSDFLLHFCCIIFSFVPSSSSSTLCIIAISAFLYIYISRLFVYYYFFHCRARVRSLLQLTQHLFSINSFMHSFLHTVCCFHSFVRSIESFELGREAFILFNAPNVLRGFSFALQVVPHCQVSHWDCWKQCIAR